MQPRIENGLGAVHLSRPIISTGSATNVTRSRTTDPGEARAWLASRYTDHELYHRSRSSGFDFVHIFAPIKEGSANFLRYGGEVEIQPGPFPDFYMLEMPVSGGVRLSLEGEDDCESSATHALFLPPNRALGSLWRPGTMQFMLKLKASEVVRRWQALVQDPGASLPAVPPQIEFQNTEGWRVQQSMLLLKAEFERGLKQGRSTLHVSPLSAAVIDSVLAYIRACHGARAEPERRTAMPAALHKCLMYFAAHYRDDIRMTDLVALTGVSERSLFNQFTEFLNTTPMRQLEQKRLAAARAQLLNAAPSVADAAFRAGFRHMGRFSKRYFETYGEKPSATMRQRPGAEGRAGAADTAGIC